MEDTTPEIKQKFYEILMSRTEEERFVMCAEMFESAKEIIISQLPPELSENRRNQLICEKLYGENFRDL